MLKRRAGEQGAVGIINIWTLSSEHGLEKGFKNEARYITGKPASDVSTVPNLLLHGLSNISLS